MRWLDIKTLFSHKGSSGVTLVELLVTMSLGSLLAVATSQVLTQVYVLTPKAENSMQAIHQVQKAGYWIDRDGACAQTITPTPGFFTLSTSTPLVISYVDWEANKTTITYAVDDNRILQKQVVIADEVTGSVISSNQMQVAENIASITAQYNQPDPENPRKILTVTITSQLGSSSETRTYKITPRIFY